MFEKVNPKHPDKIADRIAGALVDLAYTKEENPKIAVEILIGHGHCYVVIETSSEITKQEVTEIVHRITESDIDVDTVIVSQDPHLAENQSEEFRCGDNGIFRGAPVTNEQKFLTHTAEDIFEQYDSDGKYIIDGPKVVICQSNADSDELEENYPGAIVNPIGDWTGGTDVDTGAVNRKLGSDMGDAVTGGGLHGKDLSKADVSVNIYAHLKAQAERKPVEISCAIGDDTVDGLPYSEIVEIARDYINEQGGFEKFAEWGLIK